MFKCYFNNKLPLLSSVAVCVPAFENPIVPLLFNKYIPVLEELDGEADGAQDEDEYDDDDEDDDDGYGDGGDGDGDGADVGRMRMMTIAAKTTVS